MRGCPAIGVPSELAAERGIVDGARVRVTQGGAAIVLEAHVDAALAANVLRVPASHPLTAALGPMFGSVELAIEPSTQGVGAATAGAV